MDIYDIIYGWKDNFKTKNKIYPSPKVSQVNPCQSLSIKHPTIYKKKGQSGPYYKSVNKSRDRKKISHVI